MVLSYSRQIFLRFYYNAAMPSFLQGHQDAFEFFQGVPRVLLYDNLKSAVLERVGTAIRFNPKIIELSAHYRFEPRPVNVARGNEKGRVERAIRYIRDNFFEARKFGSLEDLNQQALEWMIGPSADRLCPEDRSSTVRAVFLTEKSKLLTLPDDTFPCEERVEVHSGKTPYIRFDLNDYSIPFRYVCRTLTVIASQTTVRIADGANTPPLHKKAAGGSHYMNKPSAFMLECSCKTINPAQRRKVTSGEIEQSTSPAFCPRNSYPSVRKQAADVLCRRCFTFAIFSSLGAPQTPSVRFSGRYIW
jgi:hypothetical protein